MPVWLGIVKANKQTVKNQKERSIRGTEFKVPKAPRGRGMGVLLAKQLGLGQHCKFPSDNMFCCIFSLNSLAFGDKKYFLTVLQKARFHEYCVGRWEYS